MKNKIELNKGQNYKYWLDKNNFNGRLKFVSAKETNYGYIVKLMTNYITLYTKKIYVNSDNSAKIVTLVDQNYRAKYQTTCYYDLQGFEIIANIEGTDHSITMAERKEYKRLQLH